MAETQTIIKPRQEALDVAVKILGSLSVREYKAVEIGAWTAYCRAYREMSEEAQERLARVKDQEPHP
jgi:hypothetical protein